MSGSEIFRNPQETQDEAADLLMAVELLRQLGRSELGGKDVIHALNVDELHSCKVRYMFMHDHETVFLCNPVTARLCQQGHMQPSLLLSST